MMMTPIQRRQIATAMENRSRQWRTRVGIGLIMACAFWPIVTVPFALAWFTAYCAVQWTELRWFPVSRIDTDTGGAAWAWSAVGLIALNNTVFGLFGVREAMRGDVMGLVTGGLMIGGIIVNGIMVSTGSRVLTWASLGPHILSFMALPVSMLLHGYSVFDAAQIVVAAGLLIAAAWGASARLARSVVAKDEAQSAALAAQHLAEGANRTKSEFIANVSHELRTPLNGVLGMAQAIAAGELSAVQRERIGIVTQSGEALLSIINDVLDLAKIEAGKIELENLPFRLSDLLADAQANFSALAEAKGLSLTVSVDPALADVYVGDVHRLRQVVCNLVSNGLKFTAAGGVGVCADAEGDQVRLSVTDTGPGVAPEMIATLFDKFVQADASTTRRFGGTGLGLAICEELITLMGGTVRAENIPDGGLRITVIVPLFPHQAQAAGRPDAVETDRSADIAERPLRILAAEDHPVNRQVLKVLLAQAGIDVEIVENGELAVEAWSDRAWDLVLMDVQMPVMDGPTAAQRIRALEAADGRGRTPIIALTANVLTHQIAAYREAGMDDFVGKPIQVQQLLAAIHRATQGGASAMTCAPGPAPAVRLPLSAA